MGAMAEVNGPDNARKNIFEREAKGQGVGWSAVNRAYNACPETVLDGNVRPELGMQRYFRAIPLLVLVSAATCIDRDADVRALTTRGLSVNGVITLGPAQMVETPTTGVAPGLNTFLGLASNGNGYLAIWSDASRQDEFYIRASRISPLGMIQDPHGIRLADTAPGLAVVAAGDDYVIAYVRNNVAYGKTLSSDGVAGEEVMLAQNVAPYYGIGDVLSLAWNGTHLLLVWNDPTYDVWAQRFNVNLAPADNVPVMLLDATGVGAIQLASTSNGADFFTVFKHLDAIQGIRIGANGTKVDANPIALSITDTRIAAPHVEWDGIAYFVSWQDNRPPFQAKVQGVRVRPDGTRQDISAVPLSPAGSLSATRPRLSSNGARLLLTFSSEFDLFAYGLAGNAQWTTGDFLFLSREFDRNRQGSASAGGNFLIGFSTGNGRIMGGILDGRAQPVGNYPLVISQTRNGQIQPNAIAIGRDFLVSWYDLRNPATSAQLRVTRISGSGGPIPDSRLVTDNVHMGGPPVLASSGDEAMVAWSRGQRLYWARLDLDGNVLSPGEQPFLPGLSPPVHGGAGISWGTSSYLIIHTLDTFQQRRVFGRRLGKSGNAIDAQPFFVGQMGTTDVAWTGSHHLVVGDWNGDIRAVRVRDDGTVLDTTPVLVLGTSGAVREAVGLAIGKDNTGSTRGLVVWLDYRNDGFGDLHGVIIDENGGRIGSMIVIDAGVERHSVPHVAWNGKSFSVTWSEITQRRHRTYVRCVGPDGNLLEAAPTSVSQDGGSYSWGAATAANDTHSLIFFEQYESDPDLDTVRLKVRGAPHLDFGVVVPQPIDASQAVDAAMAIQDAAPLDTATPLDTARPVDASMLRDAEPEATIDASTPQGGTAGTPAGGAGGAAGGGENAGGEAGLAAGATGSAGAAGSAGGGEVAAHAGCSCRVSERRSSAGPWAFLLAIVAWRRFVRRKP
jgi:hypothetical protein